MTTRTTSATVTFSRPFILDGFERVEPAGLADRVEIRVGAAIDTLPNLISQGPFDLIFIDADNGRVLVLVELITEVAHQLLEDVANRDDPGDTAVFVQDQGKGATLLSQLLQALEQVQGLGEHQGTADLPGYLFGRGKRDPDGAFDCGRAKEVIYEEDTLDFVQIAHDDGKTRVTSVAHRLGDGFGSDRDGEVDHVHTRRHDVAKLEFTQLVNTSLDGDGLGQVDLGNWRAGETRADPREAARGRLWIAHQERAARTVAGR